MLPAHYQYGNWPASGEIDLVESRGNGPEYPAGGYDKVASTLHWGKSFRALLSFLQYASLLLDMLNLCSQPIQPLLLLS